MGWKEAQSRYRKQKTLGDQKVEDLVARRVLRGLGFVQRDLVKVEYQLYNEAYPDEAIWPRALRVLASVFQKHGLLRMYRKWHVEALETDAAYKSVLERLEIAVQMPDMPVLMTRVKDTKLSVTFTAWDPDALGCLRPPFNVIAVLEGKFIVTQETTKFIEQFGPYDMSRLAC